MLRAGIIGCGRIGAGTGPAARDQRMLPHTQAYGLAKGVKLVAVADADPGRLSECQQQWQVPNHYTNWADMLDRESLDLVSICTPTETHYEIARSVVEHGRTHAVLLEKPMTATLEEADALVDLVQRQHVVMAVNYTRRYDPVHRQVRDWIAQQVIGRVQAANVYYTKGIVHNGTHAIDLLRFFFGEPTRAVGLGATVGGPDPTMDAYLQFPGLGSTLHGCDAEAYPIFEVDVVGRAGRIVIGDLGHSVRLLQAAPGNQIPTMVSTKKTKLAKAIKYAIEDLVRCVQNGATPICSVSDARESLRIALELRDAYARCDGSSIP